MKKPAQTLTLPSMLVRPRLVFLTLYLHAHRLTPLNIVCHWWWGFKFLTGECACNERRLEIWAGFWRAIRAPFPSTFRILELCQLLSYWNDTIPDDYPWDRHLLTEILIWFHDNSWSTELTLNSRHSTYRRGCSLSSHWMPRRPSWERISIDHLIWWLP